MEGTTQGTHGEFLEKIIAGAERATSANLTIPPWARKMLGLDNRSGALPVNTSTAA
ncbi:MAG: hypothetical protein WC548_01630 [Candidatus Pacearchaeota archaeon]